MGALSAVVVVSAQEDYPLWDVRVDHADDPAQRLRQVYEEMRERLLPHLLTLPTRDDPMGQAAREELEA